MACSHFYLVTETPVHSHKLHTHSLSLLFICQGYCVIFNRVADAGIYVCAATCIIQTFLNLKSVSYLYLHRHCGIFKHSWCSLFSENRMGVSIITSMNINNINYILYCTPHMWNPPVIQSSYIGLLTASGHNLIFRHTLPVDLFMKYEH